MPQDLTPEPTSNPEAAERMENVWFSRAEAHRKNAESLRTALATANAEKDAAIRELIRCCPHEHQGVERANACIQGRAALSSPGTDILARMERMRTALENLLERYTSLLNSGDCGDWNPEEEPTVIAAREALKS